MNITCYTNLYISNLSVNNNMDWSLRKIKANQIDFELQKLNNLTRPINGWIKTIRETLGMNTRQLGERCNISSERIIKIEADEVEEKTTLATLTKIANALNCKLVYALVPNNNIIHFIEKTAEEKAKIQLTNTSHHMTLEEQQTSTRALEEQITILKEEMLKNNIKYIWEK